MRTMMSQTARKSGWGRGGVYNGFVVSCFGIVFYRGAYFGLYDTSQDYIKNSTFLVKFSIGYTVTILAALAAYPIDTVRRRMMMTAGAQAGASFPPFLLFIFPFISFYFSCTCAYMKPSGIVGKYKGSIDCFNRILKEEGAKAMYRGAGSNMLGGLCGALVLVGFDEAQMHYLKWRNRL